MIRRRNACAIAAIFLALAGRGSADPAGDQGRAALEKSKDAIVTIQVTVKQSFSMPGAPSEGRDSTVEVSGTVIEPSGLTVVALSSIDPAAMMTAMMESMGGGDEEMKFELKSEIKDAKLLLHAGKEVPVEVVLRDKDLDLAFIRPKEKLEAPLPAVDFKNSAKVRILDEIIMIGRMGKVASRASAAEICRVTAVVEKPRTYYIPNSTGEGMTAFGSPVFDLEGKTVGVMAMRVMKGGAGGAMNMMSAEQNFLGIIVPAEDVLESAEQAPAKAEAEGK